MWPITTARAELRTEFAPHASTLSVERPAGEGVVGGAKNLLQNAGLVLAGAALGLGLSWWGGRRWRRLQCIGRHEREIVRLERLVAERAQEMTHLSHELRNPITGILGAVQTLELDKSGSGARFGLGTIHTCAVALGSLADQIAALADTAADTAVLKRELFSPLAPLMAASRMLDVEAQKAGVVFHISAAKDVPPCVLGDADRVQQIIVNYASNALKFCGGGRVDLEVATTPTGLLYRVADRGPGVAPEDRHHLFRRFSRLQAGRRAHIPGLGLGLAISRALAELMGGTTGMDGRDGGGAVFWANLKLESATIPPTATKPASEPLEADFTGVRALIVEDVSYNAELLDGVLSELGFSCSRVTNAEDALTLMTKEAFDVVFTDLDLPGMSGVEWVRQARGRSLGGGRAFYVATTAYTRESLRRRGLDEGMDAFASKPVCAEQLCALLPVRLGRGVKPGAGTARLGDSEILNFLGGATTGGRKASCELFVEVLKGGLHRMVNGLESGDRELLRRAAHQMAGYTRMLGSDCLARLAERLELSAPEAHESELASLTSELANRVQVLVNELSPTPTGARVG